MSQTPWQWDANRRQHYYFSSEENAYVYANGLRVYGSGTNHADSSRGTAYNTVQPVGTTPHGAGSNAQSLHDVTERLGNLSLTSERPQTHWIPNTNLPQNFYQGGPQWAGSASQYGNPQGRTPNAQEALQYPYPGQPTPVQLSNPYYQGTQHQPTHASAHGHRTRRDSQQTPVNSGRQIIVANVQRGPAEAITDPDALREGVQATARVFPGEKLDHRYKVRPHGWKFFTVGKVFKLLWPEPAGDGDSTDITEDKRFGERIFCKIRWFIVVKEGNDCSTCVPIQTYGKRGTTKPNLIQLEHSIVFTGREAPNPLQGEDGMLPPIRVLAKNRGDKLRRESRINFGKVYTVEHNCKVYDFGSVHPDYIDILSECWRWVLTRNTAGAAQGVAIREEGEHDSDDDDDDDDDGDDYFDEYDDDDDDGDDDGYETYAQ